MDVSKRLRAEFLGTFWLVLGGCGSAVLAAVFFTADKTSIGIGLVGVSLAFGLTVLTSAYAFGHVSGGHFNPAVTLGLVASGRFPVKDALPYIVVQVVGGLVASAVLWVVALSAKGMTSEKLAAGGFASNGFADHSPGGYGVAGALIIEVVLTAVFLFVILGATDRRATGAFAGVAIGLCLTLIHLISIPVTNTWVNPARPLDRPGAADAGRRRELAGGAVVALLDRADRRRRPRRARLPLRAARSGRVPGLGRRRGLIEPNPR